MEEFSKREIQKRPFIFGLFLILAGTLGSTFAANFTLNSGGPVQFAQGVYEIDACQTYISIDLNPDYINPGDNSAPSPGTYLDQVIINSLDTRSCANTRIGIKFFQSSSEPPLDLYEGGDGQPVKELTLDIDDADHVIIPTQDVNDDQSIDQPIFNNSDGSWTINILKPLALMSSVERLTLESGARPTPSPSSTS